MADCKKKKYRNAKHHEKRPNKERETEDADVDENSPVIKMFREFQQELDQRYDKHERIVKLSRDITIESKRAIFLLHRANGAEASELFQQTEEKLASLENTKFLEIARELVDTDPQQFIKAYTAGLQEYIEALTFYHYLKENKLITLKEAQQRLTFDATADVTAVTADVTDEKQDSSAAEDKQQNSNLQSESSHDDKEMSDSLAVKPDTVTPKTIFVPIPPTEFVLGIADLTGELMRKAINSVGSGDLKQPFKICNFLQEMESAYTSLGNSNRELNRKLTILRQSLRKVETACYTLQVRGSEIPKHMLVDVLSKVSSSQFIDDTVAEEND